MLAKMLLSSNSWHFRHAARILQERLGNSSGVSRAAMTSLLPYLNQTTNRLGRLRTLWSLHRSARAFSSPELAIECLRDQDEYIRAWTVEFSCDGPGTSEAIIEELARLAREDKSPVVRLYVAAAAQRLPLLERGEIIEALLGHGEDADDHNLPFMYWYATEPVVGKDVAAAAKLLAKTKIPVVRELITRRMTASSSKMAAN
jgi:hypothetical protein